MSNDPLAAAEALARLAVKDQNDALCRYPECEQPRRATETGRPSAYCDHPEHTALSNHRTRASLKQSASGATQERSVKRESSAGVVPVESLRTSILNEMFHLQGTLERYMTTLVEIADPDIATAQIQAVQDRAEARIADAQQAVSTERSLRLAAEAANLAAQNNAQAEREAAEQAIVAMEEADAKAQRI